MTDTKTLHNQELIDSIAGLIDFLLRFGAGGCDTNFIAIQCYSYCRKFYIVKKTHLKT